MSKKIKLDSIKPFVFNGTKKCLVIGCENCRYGGELCSKHWQREYKRNKRRELILDGE